MLTLEQAINKAHEAGACYGAIHELREMVTQNQGWDTFVEHENCLHWIEWYMDNVEWDTEHPAWEPLAAVYKKWERSYKAPHFTYGLLNWFDICADLEAKWLNYVNT